MTFRVALSLFACMLIGSLAASVLVGQTDNKKIDSVVLQAKQISRMTGRPILAIAGSNT